VQPIAVKMLDGLKIYLSVTINQFGGNITFTERVTALLI